MKKKISKKSVRRKTVKRKKVITKKPPKSLIQLYAKLQVLEESGGILEITQKDSLNLMIALNEIFYLAYKIHV